MKKKSLFFGLFVPAIFAVSCGNLEEPEKIAESESGNENAENVDQFPEPGPLTDSYPS